VKFFLHFRTFFSLLFASLLHFFYPTFCLHCEKQIFSKRQVLCDECAEMLFLKNPCLPSFITFPFHGEKKELFFDFVFENIGPAKSLLNSWGKNPHLEKSLAAYLFIQKNRLLWPSMDVIIPIKGAKTLVREYQKLSREEKVINFRWLSKRAILGKNVIILFDVIGEKEEFLPIVERVQSYLPRNLAVLGLWSSKRSDLIGI
jgi:hypothetical protein